MVVKNSIYKFGKNAGKIWNALNIKKCLKKNELLEITKLMENELYTGIGWLARENKISKENQDFYKLGNTNLVSEIGVNAGRIWTILDIWGELDIFSIIRLSDINENQVYAAIGWLAREDKIYTNENQIFSIK